MSMELFAAVAPVSIPSGQDIASAAKQLGINLEFENGFSFKTMNGFQPGKLEGIETGVEMGLHPLADFVEDIPELAVAAPACTQVVNFRWGGDMRECCFANAVAASLANLMQGVIFEPEEGVLKTAPQMVAEYHSGMAYLKTMES